MHSIYLDFNSTAPVLPEVAVAMAEAEAAGYANPASQHAMGRRAHRALEDAREEIAQLLGADLTGRAPDRLIVTSGGTEANNLALLGLVDGGRRKAEGGRMIVSAIEHPSVAAAADHLAAIGCQVDRLSVATDGVVRLEHLDQLLATESPHGMPRLVSVMLANNETGVIQPLAKIVQRCQAAGVRVHTDAVQAVGKIPVHFRELGVAAMTVAPHKFGGPRGIGALVVAPGSDVQPILHGATQQFGLRPGTESVTLAIGFLTALRIRCRDEGAVSRHMATLRDRFEAGLKKTLAEQIEINGHRAQRLPHTSNVAFLGHDRQALFMALDLAGLCCSTGSTCASGSSEPSPTLLAMRLPRNVVESSLRFSFGPSTTEQEIDEALARIGKALAGGINRS